MENDKTLKLVEYYSESCSVNNDPGHDFLHVKRVRSLALKIASTLECDLFLVELLSLLHDIEDKKLNTGHKVKDFLDNIDIEESYKEKLLYILPYMSFSKYPRLPEDFPIEGKIIQDADRLDAMGAIGIARAFSFGGNHQRKMYGSEDSTIKHFEEKLLILDQYLYFDKSKEIAKNRMESAKAFYEEFLKEIKE